MWYKSNPMGFLPEGTEVIVLLYGAEPHYCTMGRDVDGDDHTLNIKHPAFINVSVEKINYTPISEIELVSLIKKGSYWK